MSNVQLKGFCFRKLKPVTVSYTRVTICFHSTKVCSLFKDGKQTAGCTKFRTETGLRSLVSVQKLVHPAVCLQSLKREQTLI